MTRRYVLQEESHEDKLGNNNTYISYSIYMIYGLTGQSKVGLLEKGIRSIGDILDISSNQLIDIVGFDEALIIIGWLQKHGWY